MGKVCKECPFPACLKYDFLMMIFSGHGMECCQLFQTLLHFPILQIFLLNKKIADCQVQNYSGNGACTGNRLLIQDAWDKAPYGNNTRLEKLCFKDLDGQVWMTLS